MYTRDFGRTDEVGPFLDIRYFERIFHGAQKAKAAKLLPSCSLHYSRYWVLLFLESLFLPLPAAAVAPSFKVAQDGFVNVEIGGCSKQDQ
jgi:hypothetical protein